MGLGSSINSHDSQIAIVRAIRLDSAIANVLDNLHMRVVLHEERSILGSSGTTVSIGNSNLEVIGLVADSRGNGRNSSVGIGEFNFILEVVPNNRQRGSQCEVFVEGHLLRIEGQRSRFAKTDVGGINRDGRSLDFESVGTVEVEDHSRVGIAASVFDHNLDGQLVAHLRSEDVNGSGSKHLVEQLRVLPVESSVIHQPEGVHRGAVVRNDGEDCVHESGLLRSVESTIHTALGDHADIG